MTNSFTMRLAVALSILPLATPIFADDVIDEIVLHGDSSVDLLAVGIDARNRPGDLAALPALIRQFRARDITTDHVIQRILATVPATWVSPKPNDAFGTSAPRG